MTDATWIPCEACGTPSDACDAIPAPCCEGCRATGGCTHGPVMAPPADVEEYVMTDAACPSCTPAHVTLTDDGQDNTCTHGSATGIDTTPVSDPSKVWRCDHCGLCWSDASPIRFTAADLAARESALRAQIKAEVQDFADSRGISVGDDDSDWWKGYRQAQRECLHDASDLAARIVGGEQA